jgi:hypothetical protein
MFTTWRLIRDRDRRHVGGIADLADWACLRMYCRQELPVLLIGQRRGQSWMPRKLNVASLKQLIEATRAVPAIAERLEHHVMPVALVRSAIVAIGDVEEEASVLSYAGVECYLNRLVVKTSNHPTTDNRHILLNP